MDYWTLYIAALLIVAARIGYMWWRPRRVRRIWERGLAALEQGDYAAAEGDLRACTKIEPTFSPARRLLARAQVKLHKLDEAEEQLQMASKFEPKNAEAHAELGLFLARYTRGREEEAVEELRKAVTLAPGLREHLRRAQGVDRLLHHERLQAALDASSSTHGDEPADTPP